MWPRKIVLTSFIHASIIKYVRVNASIFARHLEVLGSSVLERKKSDLYSHPGLAIKPFFIYSIDKSHFSNTT